MTNIDKYQLLYSNFSGLWYLVPLDLLTKFMSYEEPSSELKDPEDFEDIFERYEIEHFASEIFKLID